jgi:hypothetical protein
MSDEENFITGTSKSLEFTFTHTWFSIIITIKSVSQITLIFHYRQ